MRPNIEAFFDPATGTISYVVFDDPGGSCAIIDPVLDYDARSGRTRTSSADKLIGFIRSQRLKVEWILDTHVHADHLTSAQYLQEKLGGGKTGIGNEVPKVQNIFKKIFNLGPEFIPDGSHFDYLLSDQEAFKVGKLEAKAIFTSGHTPADMTYQFDEVLFVGDTLFMPDLGTAHADFPAGDARRLFRSIRKILDQPVQTKLFMCQDYLPHTREARWETTIAEQRLHNIHVHDGISEDDFVAMREARDATLDMPMLLLPSVQVNVRAGRWLPMSLMVHMMLVLRNSVMRVLTQLGVEPPMNRLDQFGGHAGIPDLSTLRNFFVSNFKLPGPGGSQLGQSWHAFSVNANRLGKITVPEFIGNFQQMGAYQPNLVGIGSIFGDDLLQSSTCGLGEDMDGLFQVEWHYMRTPARHFIEPLFVHLIHSVNCHYRK